MARYGVEPDCIASNAVSTKDSPDALAQAVEYAAWEWSYFQAVG